MEQHKIKYYIDADAELRRWLAEKFGSSLPSVSRALSYTDNSDKARRLRKIAMEHGAVKMEVRVAEYQLA